MSLLYYPKLGEILICDFSTGFIIPEMVKRRPVIVIGPRLRRRADLVTIVPLSTTPPRPPQNYHSRLELQNPLPRPFDSSVMWAKCDMVVAVSRQRLDRFREPRKRDGSRRKWRSGQANPEQIKEIRKAVLCGLGLDSLTI